MELYYKPLKVTSCLPKLDLFEWPPAFGDYQKGATTSDKLETTFSERLIDLEFSVSWGSIAPSGQYLEHLENERLWFNYQWDRAHAPSVTETVALVRDSFAQLYETLPPYYPTILHWDTQPHWETGDAGRHGPDEAWAWGLTPPCSGTEKTLAFALVFDQLLQKYDRVCQALSAQTGACLGLPNYGVQAISEAIHSERVERTVRNFFVRLNTARRLVHHVVRAFCGISWTRRLWHLLHGSHPPKSEGSALCQAFGCA
ncbi:MAG: hypothetical protein WCC14_17095 [Acidobacteriaceae bacterium]